jgi:steroid delta-isomerase-like uncharacterized protein
MSTEENKALVRRWYEEFNKHSLAGIAEDCVPGYVVHGTSVFPDTDLAGMQLWCTVLWTALPDMHVVVEDLIAEGDKVVSRLTIRGTLQGDFLGIPPTGKQVSVTGIGIDRIENDKFVESWGNFDALGLMQELGAIPQMA